jgi:hypothetical protein
MIPTGTLMKKFYCQLYRGPAYEALLRFNEPGSKRNGRVQEIRKTNRRQKSSSRCKGKIETTIRGLQ